MKFFAGSGLFLNLYEPVVTAAQFQCLFASCSAVMPEQSGDSEQESEDKEDVAAVVAACPVEYGDCKIKSGDYQTNYAEYFHDSIQGYIIIVKCPKLAIILGISLFQGNLLQKNPHNRLQDSS